jgi:hypothetical protein
MLPSRITWLGLIVVLILTRNALAAERASPHSSPSGGRGAAGSPASMRRSCLR